MKKLVRDKYENIIKDKPLTRCNKRAKQLVYLKKKFIEEVKELTNTNNKRDTTKELADVLTIMEAYMDFFNIDFDDVEKMYNYKLNKFGKFDKFVILGGK